VLPFYSTQEEHQGAKAGIKDQERSACQSHKLLLEGLCMEHTQAKLK